jgi:hypothetical protein
MLSYWNCPSLKYNRFWGIFWVDVSTPSLAENDFLHIASQLGVSVQTWEEARQCLANLKESWLLVLDNADDVDIDYQQYFPAAPSGVVLLTTRNTECQHYATARWIDLKGLSDSEARELLLKAIHVPQGRHLKFEDDDTQAVTRLLRSHPLAIIQAGSYISRGHCSLNEYPNVHQRQRKRLLTFRPSQACSRYGDIYTTFEASAKVLQSSNTDSARDALQLLSVLAALGTTPLPLLVFEAAWKGSRTISMDSSGNDNSNDDLRRLTSCHLSRLLSLISPDSCEWDSFRLVEAVNQLKSFSLVSTEILNNSGLSVSMHPLIHAGPTTALIQWNSTSRGLQRDV